MTLKRRKNHLRNWFKTVKKAKREKRRENKTALCTSVREYARARCRIRAKAASASLFIQKETRRFVSTVRREGGGGAELNGLPFHRSLVPLNSHTSLRGLPEIIVPSIKIHGAFTYTPYVRSHRLSLSLRRRLRLNK